MLIYIQQNSTSTLCGIATVVVRLRRYTVFLDSGHEVVIIVLRQSFSCICKGILKLCVHQKCAGRNCHDILSGFVYFRIVRVTRTRKHFALP